MSQTLHIGESIISYRQCGSGKRLLIGLHGFASYAKAFEPLEEVMCKHFTVVCFDLPFHGETVWAKTRFTSEDMATLIKQVLAMTGFERFSLMGHSMGGRIALNLLELFAEQIDEMFLFAPAGLRGAWFYRRELMPPIARKWGRRYLVGLQKPPSLFYALKRIGILPRYAANLLEANFNNPQRRTRMLNTWVSLYDFDIQPRRHGRLIEKHQIRVHIFMGEFDKAIPVSDGVDFVARYPSVDLCILPVGHNIITEPCLAAKLEELLTKS